MEEEEEEIKRKIIRGWRRKTQVTASYSPLSGPPQNLRTGGRVT